MNELRLNFNERWKKLITYTSSSDIVNICTLGFQIQKFISNLELQVEFSNLEPQNALLPQRWP